MPERVAIGGQSIKAVLLGVLVAAGLGLVARWLIWPLIFNLHLLDLSRPTSRLGYTVLSALPAVAAGFVAARLAPNRPLGHGVVAGSVLLIPMAFGLPFMLRAFQSVPQSILPLALAVALRPLGAALGAYLTGRVKPTAPPGSGPVAGRPSR